MIGKLLPTTSNQPLDERIALRTIPDRSDFPDLVMVFEIRFTHFWQRVPKRGAIIQNSESENSNRICAVESMHTDLAACGVAPVRTKNESQSPANEWRGFFGRT